MGPSCCGATASVLFQAGPRLFVASLCHLRPQVISLDVTQHGQIMIMGLNRECFEPPLPDMPAVFVMPLIAPNMDVMSHCIQRLRSPW